MLRPTDNCVYRVPLALLGREGTYYTRDEAETLRVEEEAVAAQEDREPDLDWYWAQQE